MIKIKGLTKDYGFNVALNNISFTVETGNVVGIIGPNGSGKTTMLSLLTGILSPTSGKIEFDDNFKIGALIDTPAFYNHLSAIQNLELVAQIKGITNVQIDELLKMVGLEKEEKKKFSKYSLGMKQRLGIAAAILGSSNTIILDEPTNGLDPIGIKDIRNIILDLIKQGNTLLIRSHILNEIENYCSHYAILKEGEMVFYGSKDELLNLFEQKVIISSEDVETIRIKIINLEGISKVESLTSKSISFIAKGSLTSEKLYQWAISENVKIIDIKIETKTLEDIFFKIIQ